MADKGGVGLLMLGRPKGKPPGAEPDGDEDLGDSGDAETEAASSIIDALDSKDPAALKDALSTFVDLCTSKGYPEEEG